MRLRLAIGKGKACEVGLEDTDEQAGDDECESEEELIEDCRQEAQTHDGKGSDDAPGMIRSWKW